MSGSIHRLLWAKAWKGKPCAVCHQRATAGHHIVYIQHLRREGKPKWDPRNCLPLCMKCHADHHSGMRRVPASLLPNEAYEHAIEHGFEYFINRYYATNPKEHHVR